MTIEAPKIKVTLALILIGGRAYPRNMSHTFEGQAVEAASQHQPAGTVVSFLDLYDQVLAALTTDAGSPKIGDAGGSKQVRYMLRQA